MKRILITGALGQIGSELTMKLRETYGAANVIATDIKKNNSEAAQSGPFEVLDVTDLKKMIEVAKKYQVDTVMHLAALLSATAEAKPLFAWNLNMGGLINALETARTECPILHPKFNRCLWTIHAQGQDTTRYHHAAYHHVWGQ